MKYRLLFILLLTLLCLETVGCMLQQPSYYGPHHLYRIDTDTILLSFDDGPTANTSKILDILKKNGVKAAFFFRGDKAQKHPELVARAAREGHYIGNHSYSHPKLTKQSMDVSKQQVLRTDQVLKKYTTKKWFRPPYGELSFELSKWLEARGYTIVRWSSIDYHNLQPGDILLLHETDGVVDSLPNMIMKINEVLANKTTQEHSESEPESVI